MKFDVKFEEKDQRFDVSFGEFQDISDGGYERGLAEGYANGEADGRASGLAEGEQIGYGKGYEKGNSDGHAQGVTEGYANGEADTLEKRTELTVTENGEYTPEGESTGFKSVSVSVQAVSKLPQVIDRTITEVAAEDLVGVTSIGNSAFRFCALITSVTVPDSVTNIDEFVFQGCTALESVTIGDGVTSIGQYSFYGCTSLKSVTIGKGIRRIDDNVFVQCAKVTSLTVQASTPPTIKSYTLSGLSNGELKIYVPASSLDAYKAATNWSAKADQIRAIAD